MYSHFDHEGHAEGTETAALAGPQLRLHRLGDWIRGSDDELILEFPENDQLIFWPEVTDDDRFVASPSSRAPRTATGSGPTRSSPTGVAAGWVAPIKIVDEPVAEFVLAGSTGSTLFLQHRPERRTRPAGAASISISSRAPDPDEWPEVLAESADTLSMVAAGRGRLRRGLSGRRPARRSGASGWTARDLGAVAVAGGAVLGPERRAGRPGVLRRAVVGHLTDPELPAARRTPGTSRRCRSWCRPAADLRRPGGPGGTQAGHQRRRHGGAVLLDQPDGADLSRPQPTLLWGYGGFKIPIFADYRPGWSGWLAAGGLLAIANLRGGGEFGTEWYDAGRLDRKQNVFDDFIAVAEHLVQTRGDHARAAGGARPQQRRAAGRRGDDPAPRSGRGRAAGGRRTGHAAVPPVHHRRRLDLRLRRPGRSRAVRGRAGLLAAAQRQARDPAIPPRW